MRIIILGNGNAGKFLFDYFSNRFDSVINLTRKDFDAVNIDTNKFKSIIKENDVVINCVGILKPNIKKVGEFTTYKINAIFPNIIYNICKFNSAHFIHICSDCVYKGDVGNYSEEVPPDATDIYALSKSMVNRGIILRTSFIGSKGGLMKWVLDNKNKQIDGYENCLWNGITTLELAKRIKEIIEYQNFWTGVRHLHNPKTISKYELCCLINKIYNLNISIRNIKATEIEGTKINGVLDRSLSTKCNNWISNKIPCIEQQIKELYEFESKQSQRMGST
tara:strand:- start:5031 stop:5864 length:834 start_codon:yes stop_codon:yes gene_type:complete